MPIKDDDVLNVLNSNTQNNNYNEGKTQDDVLGVLSTNTQELPSKQTNSFGIGLSPEEEEARTAGSADYSAGVNHEDYSEIAGLKSRSVVRKEPVVSYSDENVEQRRADILSNLRVNDDGSVNTTKSLATDLVEEEKSLSVSELYKNVLGRTAYEELKSMCGLSADESFTDYYNRTKYIPKGFEMEARMCMVEERRMKLFTEYANGNLSETDFLYQAYGKDLMKEAGYDLSNKLFWYSRVKNKDFSNPLDNDAFVSDLITNARNMFQNETWYRESQSKELSETLAGLVTGNRLSDEKFYEIFKEQVDALKPYFDEDVNKIITYYKAGSLGSAFSPFIDIDGDGKYDYYYHTDGRLYAVEDSNGVGKSKCEIVYNDDNTVHSVQIKDGFDGPVDSFLEGFRDFFVGILDIVHMIDSAAGVSAVVHAAKDDKYFIDAQQDWEAFKKSTWALGDEDYVTFDDIKNYKGKDWGNAVAKGVGQVAGMIVLTIATWGIGTAASAGGTAIETGTQAGTEAAAKLVAESTKEGVKQVTKEGVKLAVQEVQKQVVEKLGENASKAVVERAAQQAVASLGQELARQLGKTAFEETAKGIVAFELKSLGTTAAKLAIKNAGTAIAKGANVVLQAGTKGRSGFVVTTKGFMGNVWAQSMQVAATNAIKDFVTVGSQLEARNKGLMYLEKATGGQVKALTSGQIWSRAAYTAGADFVISSLLRAQGDTGVTTRWNALFKNHSDLTSEALAILNDPALTSEMKNSVLNMTNHMGAAMWVDNAFDIIENITTAGAQAAFSNPYAELGSPESWQTFWQSAYNPQSIIMNAYIGMKNTISYGTSSNLADSRKATFVRQANLSANDLGNVCKTYITKLEEMGGDPKVRDAAIAALEKLQAKLMDKLQPKQSDLSKTAGQAQYLNNIMEAASDLDKVFSVEDNTAIEAFGLTKQEASEVRESIKLLNSNRPQDVPEYGLATAVLFNKASKSYAESVKEMYKLILNRAAEQSTHTNKVWRTIADWSGNLPFGKYIAAKKMQGSFNAVIESVARKSNIDIQGIRNIDLRDLIISNRFKTLSLDTGTSYSKFKQAIDSGLIKTYVMNNETALDGLLFDLEEYEDKATGKKGYNVKVLDNNRQEVNKDKFADNPFMQLLMDKANNKQAIEQLMKMGIITSPSNPNERESLYSILSSGTPWFVFTVDDARRNEILAKPADGETNPLRDIIIAMDTIADLCNPELSSDVDGYAGIDWTMPVLTRVSYKHKNGSGGETESSLYIIPNQSKSKHLDVVNRLQAAQALVYNYYKILTLSKYSNATRTAEQDAELQAAVAQMSYLMNEDLVMNDYEDFNKVISDPEKRKAYLQERLPLVAKTILFKADMSKDETADGFGRNQLIKLYKDGILNKDILTEFSEQSEKNTKVGGVARELLKYTELVNETKTVLGIVDRLNSNGELSNSDLTSLKKYVEMMKDPNNSSIRSYLEKDNHLSQTVQRIIDDPTKYIPFFNGLVGNGRHLSQAECSAILEKRRINDKEFQEFLGELIGNRYNDFFEMSNTYITSAKKTLTKIFYGNDYKYETKGNYFKNLSADKVLEFMTDPFDVISKLPQSKLNSLFGKDTLPGISQPDRIKLTQDILTDAGYIKEDGSLDSNKIFIDTYNFENEKPFDAIQIKRELLKGQSEQAKLFRNFILIANTDYIGELPTRIIDSKGNEVDYIRVKDGNLVIGKDDTLLGDFILNNQNVKQLITESKKDLIIDRIKSDIELYDQYIGQGSSLTDAKNIIEVNLLELLPKNLKSATLKFIESVEAKTQRGRRADIINNEIKEEMEKLFTGSFSNSTTEQYTAYKKMVLSKIISGNFLYSYDINDDRSLRKFKTLMQSLGYGNDVEKVISRAIQIDGVTVKDKPVHAIQSELQAQKLFEKLIELSPVTFISSVKEGKDYKFILSNLFSGNVYSDDNTVFNKSDFDLTNNYSILGPIEEWTLNEGLDSIYFDRAIKAALQGGNFADYFTILNKQSTFEGTRNEDSFQTYKALTVINRVLEYLYGEKTEYKNIALRVAANDKTKQQQIEAMYSKPNSIWKIVNYDAKNKCYNLALNTELAKDTIVEEFINNHISNNKNQFDFRELIPIWDAKPSLKSVDVAMNKDISFETLFSIVSELDLENLKTPEDFVNYGKQPIQLMDLNKKSYDDLVSTLSGKTLKEIESILSTKEELLKDNYYANLLEYYIKTVRASSKVLLDSLNTEETSPIIKLCNRDILDNLGELLNTEYKHIFDNKSIDANEVNKLTESLSKLTNKEIDSKSVTALLNILLNAEENQLVYLSTDTGLAKHNSTLNAFSFLEIGGEGKLNVSLEDYIKASKQDREVFLWNLDKLSKQTETFSKEEISAIKTLISTLETKDDLITQLGSDRELTVEDQRFKNFIKGETTSANEPTIQISPEEYFLSNGSNFNKKLVAELVASSRFLKQGQDKFVALSAISETGNTVNDLLSKFMHDVLGRTLDLTTDKLGSALVYNMQSDEGIAEFFMSSYTWANYIKEALYMNDEGQFINKFKGLNEKQVNKMLYDLAMQANLYSTGTTFAAEYAGALMLEYDPKTKQYEIKPILTSVSNPDDDILTDLMIGPNRIKDKSDKVQLMVKVNQNTFIDNISGYASGFEVFDFTDDEVRQSVYAAAYYNAKHNKGIWYIHPDKQVDVQTVIKDYYIDNYKLKAYDLRKNFYDKCKQLGLSDEVIKSTLQNVENVSASQPTSWSEQAIETLKHQVGITKDGFIPNYQFEALHDALLYGINKASLSDETIIGFKNYILKTETGDMSSANTILDSIKSLDVERQEIGYKNFADLTIEEQKHVILHLLLDESNVNGLTLTLISNARKGKSLWDVYEKMITENIPLSFANDIESDIYVKPLNDMMNNLKKYIPDEKDFESLLKSINFDALDLSHDQQLFDDVDIYNNNIRFTRNNKFLNEVVSAFQLMETSKSLRADSKELANRIKDAMYGNAYTGMSRTHYINSIKKQSSRNEVRTVFLNLLAVNGYNLDNIKIRKDNDIHESIKDEKFGEALFKTFNSISMAAAKYCDDLKKQNPYNEEIQRMGTTARVEEFLASGIKNMNKYLSEEFKGVTPKQYSEDILKQFDSEYGKKYFDAVVENFDFRRAERNSNIKKFVDSVMNPIYQHMSSETESYFKNINPDFLISNLIRVSGYTTEGAELYAKKLEQYRKFGNIIEITSQQNKELNDYIVNDLFKNELFQKKALWSMTREHQEFINGIPYGCIKVNPKILEQAFGMITSKNQEFYTLMWRQPGQQRTVMHNVKIIADDSVSGIAFSRRTARDYFNGDFDGDSYYFAQPGKDSAYFGEKTFDVLNYGGSIYDSLLKDVDVPETSAKEFSDIEKKVRPFFEADDTVNLIKGLYEGTTTVDDFNKAFESWLLDNTDLDVNKMLDAFGFKERKTMMQKHNKVITSSNYLLSQIGDAYRDVLQTIDDNNQIFLRAAFLLSDDDATWLGQSSKGQMRNYKVKDTMFKKVSDALYETTVGMSKDSNAQLSIIFKSLQNNPEAMKQIKVNLSEYIDLGLKQGFISTKLANTLKTEIENKPTLNQDDILVVAQLLQINKVNSQAYDNIVTEAIKAPETSIERTKLNQKLQGVIDIMKKVGGYDGLADLQAELRANPYGPQSLKIGSELVSMLLDRRLLRNPLFMSSSDTTGAAKLLKDFATKSNVDIISKNNINFIGHKNFSNINKNVVGLSGKVIIAVQTNGEYTDSIGVYDRSRNGEKNLNVNQSVSYALNDMTASQKEKLFSSLKSLNGDVDNKDLATIFKDSSFKIKGRQRVLGVVDRIGNFKSLNSLTIDDLNRGAQIMFNNASSLIDHVNNHVVKFGAATTKDFKGTGYATDIVFDSKYKGDDVPQFILDKKLASLDKLSPLTGFKNLNKTIVDASGKKEFALFEIDNMALLNVLDMEDMSFDNRNIDMVSLLSGSQGIDASFNIGSLFITINSDGKVAYDPSGYWNLMSTIGKYTKPVLQDVNGCNLVRYNRIAILLDQLDKTQQAYAIRMIANAIGSEANTPKDILTSLEKVGDLGGYCGQSIESFLYSRMSNEQKQKFGKMLQKEEGIFARVFFSHEIQDALNSEIQTSGEYDSNYVSQKKEDIAHSNPRIANVSNYSEGINYERAMEGSAEDLNTAFISRRAILNLLIQEINEKSDRDIDMGLNNTLINSMIREGQIQPEDIWSGNIADEYRPILKYQGLYLDPKDYPERTQSKKDGRFYKMNMAIRNEETENLINYVKPSLLSNNNYDYDDAMICQMNDINGLIGKEAKRPYYAYTPATRLLPYLTKGTDVDIFDGLTGYKNQFFVEQMSKRLSTANDKLTLTPEWSTPEDLQIQGAPEHAQYLSAVEASEYLKHIQDPEQSKNYAELLDSKTTLMKEELRNLNILQRLHLLEDRQTLKEQSDADKAFRELLKNEPVNQETGHLESYENFRTIDQGKYEDACWDNLSESNLITAVQLTSSRNGYEFYNSAMRSWGFKSENNMDIALGSKVLRLNKVSDNEAKTLLGNEYVRLVNASKYSKDLALQLEQYLQAKKLMELYESFVGNENAFRKAMPTKGKDSYDACMNRLMDTINQQGGLQTLKTYLDDLYKNNVELSILIDDATAINKRIVEAAKQESPYEFVSWFVRLDDKESNNKWFGFEHVNAFDLSHQKFDDVLNGSMSYKSKGKLASIFSGTDDGYLASVTIAATNLAKKKSVKSLAKYMMDNGYMSNLKLYATGIDTVDKTLKSFLDSYTNDLSENKINPQQYEYDKATYEQLKFVAIENGLSPDEFKGYESFLDLYHLFMNTANEQRETLHYTSFESLVESRNAMQGLGNDNADREKLNSAINIFNAAQNTLSTMVAMMVERGQFKSADEFLTSVYNLAKNNIGDDYIIVDKYGAKLEEEDTYVPSFLTGFDMNDAIRELKYGKGISGDKKKAAIAQMILCGDAFAMKKSLADQLERKVFTKLKHSKFYNLINKCKNLATSLIMSSPTQLLDRVINFPTFDLGVDATADFRTLNEISAARATVNKFVAMFDTLTQDQIESDKDMQYLIRFLYASNQELKNATSYRGEKLATGTLPVLKQYLKTTNQLYTIGNMIPRFAYFLNMVKNAEANGYAIDPMRMGVAYHMQDGIKAITNDADADVYKYIEGEENKQLAANLDAQAVQVIAEHNGIEGNMPYAATWLNEHFNTMFVTFPMALLRWADNRIRSLGFALSQCTKGAEGWTYLGDQVLSNALTGALLLMLQLALSSNTQEWLKKKASKKDDEITDEEQEAAQNILFRGGQVKLFGSLLAGEEVSTAAHSRGPVAALFDSYVSDFIPKYNGGETNFGKNLMNKIKEKTMGHMPFVLKDAIESIPGNTWLQSSTYYSPGDNYLENYGRKALGYALGTANANALIDYYQTADQTTDDRFLKKLKDGMTYAYSRKFANTKEAKSEHRNYKKAFSLVYEYKHMTETNYEAATVTSDNQYFSDLKSDLQNALMYMNDSSALYKVISDYKQKGVSLKTIKSALKSLSLKQQILGLDNYQTFMQTLSAQEKATIKSAIAYEDYNYPFLDDVYDSIADEYQKEKAKTTSNYVSSVGSLLKTMNYNTPKYYGSYNSNYKRYKNYSNYINFLNRYLNNVAYNNKYSNQSSPLNAYEQARQNQAYGTSKDVWGNETRHYTDGTTYSVRRPGMPFPGGNE